MEIKNRKLFKELVKKLTLELLDEESLEEILSNPIEFKKKSGEPGFYQKYEDLKIKLENSFIAWEKTVEKSSALNEELKKLET